MEVRAERSNTSQLNSLAYLMRVVLEVRQRVVLEVRQRVVLEVRHAHWIWYLCFYCNYKYIITTNWSFCVVFFVFS